LQVDTQLIDALHAQEFEVAVETNGTIAAPTGIDWICVSPKSGANWVQRRGHELKLVYPQVGLMPESFTDVDFNFDHMLLQPMDGPLQRQNTQSAINYCKAHPQWRLSVQTHKVLNIR